MVIASMGSALSPSDQPMEQVVASYDLEVVGSLLLASCHFCYEEVGIRCFPCSPYWYGQSCYCYLQVVFPLMEMAHSFCSLAVQTFLARIASSLIFLSGNLAHRS